MMQVVFHNFSAVCWCDAICVEHYLVLSVDVMQFVLHNLCTVC